MALVDGDEVVCGEVSMRVYLRGRELGRPTWACLNVAAAMLSQNNPSSAVAMLKLAAAVDGHDADVQWLLGRALGASGDHSAALAALDKSIQAAPDRPEIAADWGRAALGALETGWVAAHRRGEVLAAATKRLLAARDANPRNAANECLCLRA